MRTTSAVLLVLALLLLANLVLPQARVDPAAVQELASRGPVLRFLLVTLGLGEVPTSPVFLGALVLFFLDLAAVLAWRARATLARMRAVAPSAATRQRLWSEPSALRLPLPAGFGAGWAHTVLARLGYRVARPAPGCVWGVANRTAALGFLVFHLSFFVLCGGGILLYYTRFVATLVVAEGETFAGKWAAVVRASPLPAPVAPAFTLERLEPHLDAGRPIQLAATVRRAGAPSSETARVNEPIEWGDTTLLVERAGLAPVLWLQDARGYTVDRVVAAATPVDGGFPSVPLLAGALAIELEPVTLGAGLPDRDALGRAALPARIRRGGELVWQGELGMGTVVRLGDHHLRVEEMRYWALFRLVRERGGLLLVAGFVLGVAGLVWRMLWSRREVTVLWDERAIVVHGRAEYYPLTFRGELEAIATLLAEPRAAEAKP